VTKANKFENIHTCSSGTSCSPRCSGHACGGTCPLRSGCRATGEEEGGCKQEVDVHGAFN